MTNLIIRYRDLNMRYKLFLQYLLLLLLSFTCLSSSITGSRPRSRRTGKYSSRQVFEQSRMFVEYKLGIVKNVPERPFVERAAQECSAVPPIITSTTTGYGTSTPRISASNSITRSRAAISSNEHVHEPGADTVNETDDFMRTDRIAGTAWYGNLLKSTHTS